ncbi:MAG: divalent metal cation transporter [bacterium]
MSEIFNWKGSINSNWHKGKTFYLVIIVSVLLGAIMNLMGVDPIKSLIWTAIGYGLTAPVLIAVIIRICNNKSIMGKFVNGKWANIL